VAVPLRTRFLVPVLPFLTIGAAVAWGSMRRRRGTAADRLRRTLTVQTATGPLLVVTTTSGLWYRFRHGQFVATLGTPRHLARRRASPSSSPQSPLRYLSGSSSGVLAKGAATATTTFVAWFCVSELAPHSSTGSRDTPANRRARRHGIAAVAAVADAVRLAPAMPTRRNAQNAMSVAFCRPSASDRHQPILLILSATVAAAPQLRPQLARAASRKARRRPVETFTTP